jgi:hypothetical protein
MPGQNLVLHSQQSVLISDCVALTRLFFDILWTAAAGTSQAGIGRERTQRGKPQPKRGWWLERPELAEECWAEEYGKETQLTARGSTV